MNHTVRTTLASLTKIKSDKKYFNFFKSKTKNQVLDLTGFAKPYQ